MPLFFIFMTSDILCWVTFWCQRFLTLKSGPSLIFPHMISLVDNIIFLEQYKNHSLIIPHTFGIRLNTIYQKLELNFLRCLDILLWTKKVLNIIVPHTFCSNKQKKEVRIWKFVELGFHGLVMHKNQNHSLSFKHKRVEFSEFLVSVTHPSHLQVQEL